MRGILWCLALLPTGMLGVVGQRSLDDGQVVSEKRMATNELLAPEGRTLTFGARPIALSMMRDGVRAWVKDSRGVRIIDIDAMKELSQLNLPGGASLTGVAALGDGEQALATNAASELLTLRLGQDGKIAVEKTLTLTAPGGEGASFPCGIALNKAQTTAFVCLSRHNAVAEVDLASLKVSRTFDVGVAPFECVLDEKSGFLYATCQGGPSPGPRQRSARSAGTEVSVDLRGVADSGSVSVVDLAHGKEAASIRVGLQPSGLAWVPNSRLLSVANSNEDSVTLIDVDRRSVVETIDVKPDPRLPFGSMPSGIAATTDGRRLMVSLSGNNAVAVIDVNPGKSKVRGFVPTAWYPTSIALAGNRLVIANTKGFGSRIRNRKPETGWNSHDQSGAIQVAEVPSQRALARLTQKVLLNARAPQVLAAIEQEARATAGAKPIPDRVGEPSLIRHVVYVIKENRTYDQLLGDMKEGNGDPNLCVFPENITPNHHALAREFVLLDNYYCNGVLSADGHSWATEGNVTPYLERAFGGFTRSYTFGDDPLTYSSTGFLWDWVLAKGLSFHNFGEMDYAEPPKGWTVKDVWRAYESGQDAVFEQNIGIDRVRRYSSRSYPGWNMGIPDVLRMDRFLKVFREWEKAGSMPNLTVVYLPQDHTAGTTPGYPTPASYLADNDLALGRLVEAISSSQFWPKTAIFVTEDDPQAGFDHIDGHRSICLIASPYAKRNKTVSAFYNQDSVLHTVCRIFGIAAPNQKIAAGPVMSECFVAKPNLKPFRALDPQVDLKALNPPLVALAGPARERAERSARLPLSRPGLKSSEDDDALNRILWHAMKGERPYPAEWAGYHGRGLKERRLMLDPEGD